MGCNYSLKQHLVARYVYIYYMEKNNNYMFRHMLMAVFGLYMLCVNAHKRVFHIQPEDGH
jgi:hypothetical protein